jgi:hypothetical protein
VCILEHPYTAALPLLTAVLDEIGVDSIVLTGPYTRIDEEYWHMSDYEIEEDTFAKFLDGWLND